MKRVLIIHGWGANSQSNWFPWLKQELEKQNVKVYCPDLPNSEYPNQDEWLKEIKELVGKFDESLSIVGHSLGSITILRILESLSDDESKKDNKNKERIDKAILVSGFTNHLGIKQISDFFKTDFNWQKIRKKANKIVVINSDNDPYVPLEDGKKLSKMLNADFIIEHNAGHINMGTGYFKYEKVLDILTQ